MAYIDELSAERNVRPTLAEEFRRDACAHANAVFDAREDPSAFAAYCFTDPAGMPLRQAPLHHALQAFLSRHRKALIELPRDHGKSVQICARTIWELGRDTSLRVKIVCATEGIAAERGRFLRDAIARNGKVRRVFPWLLPAEPWTETRFTVERPANAIGPSATALGVGAGLTGTRADLLICDDIVDVKSLVSRAERERTKSFFRDNLMNLLEPDGRCWCLCTPWHRDDLNAQLKRNEAFALFRRAVTPELEPVWSARWPRERLEERRLEIGAASFARGYRLVPLAEEEATIRASWVQFWTEDEAGRIGNPSHDVGSDFDRLILAVDPAVALGIEADASALVVLGARHGSLGRGGNPGPINEIRCLDAMAQRVRVPDLVRLIERLDRRWNPQAILFESNAGFLGIKDLLTRHASFGPKIVGINQSRGKAVRIEAFSVPVRNGVFRLKGGGADPLPQPLPEAGRGEGFSPSPVLERSDGFSPLPASGRGWGRGSSVVHPSQRPLFDEMTTFPVGERDDLVDAAAMGTEYLLNTREPRVW